MLLFLPALNKLEELLLSNNRLTTLLNNNFNFYNHNPESGFLQIDLSYNQISVIE